MQKGHRQDLCLIGADRRIGYVQSEGTFLQKLEAKTGLRTTEVSQLTMEDGEVYEIPTHFLEKDRDGSYRLRRELHEIEKYRCEPEVARRTSNTSSTSPGTTSSVSDDIKTELAASDPPEVERDASMPVETFPVIEEEASIETRTRKTARVQVRKAIKEEHVTIDEPSYRTTVDVKRVPVGKYVDGPVADRTEGDTLIVPVLEEVVVVEKRLLLKEELHITRQREEYRDPQQMTLRKEDVVIHRSELNDSPNQQSTKHEEISNG